MSDLHLLPRRGGIVKYLPLTELFSQLSFTYSFDISYLVPCIKIICNYKIFGRDQAEAQSIEKTLGPSPFM